MLTKFHNNFYSKLNKNFSALLITSILIQTVFLFANPIGFECDGAMFYNYAKSILLKSYSASDYRPPGFPIFQIATGQIWPGTFILSIFSQLAMGITMPILIYKILERFGNGIAVLSSILLILSTVTYNYSTLILSDQLFGFTFLLSIFLFTKFYFDREKKFIKWFVITSLFCSFTRWEGIFLLFNGIIYISYYYFKCRNYKSIFILLTSIFLILFSFTILRAIYFKDIKMVGSLQNGSGSQLLFRIYNADYSYLINNDFKKPADGNPQSLSNSDTGYIDTGNSKQYFNPKNGSYSKKLSEIVENYAKLNPDSYRSIERQILSLPISTLYDNSYKILFGRFDGEPKKLVEHIFSAPSNGLNAQYVFYIDRAVKSTLGVVEGDKLLVKASIETIYSNPIIIQAMINDSLSLLGINILRGPLANYSQISILNNLKSFFPYWDRNTYSWLDFDLGKCASNALNQHMLSEIIYSYKYTNKEFNNILTDIASYNRNLSRLILGLTFILFGWVLLFSKNKFYIYFLIGSLLPMILIYGLYIGGAGSRYEVATLPILIVIVSHIIIIIRDKFKLK